MKKIIFIIPYFGKFPTYFKMWLKSVEFNKDIDFLLITDNEISNKPKNIKIIKMSFEECVDKIKSHYDFKISIPTPYRLSTFKPAYGEIFETEIIGYDFWGWCDIDMIFGNLRHFFTDHILDNHDRILSHGHLCLIRNTKKMNRLYRINKFDCMNYKDAFSSGILFNNFDEYPYGLPRIADKEGVSAYKKCIFADLDSFFFTFRKLATYLSEEDDSENIIQIFKWSYGKLSNIILLDDKREEIEIAYVHFQKREMQCDIENMNEFIIIPNCFLDNQNLSNIEIRQICDLERNAIYCNEIKKMISEKNDKNLFYKLFSIVHWKNRWFRFKMKKIIKVKPYIFSKGGF